MQCSPSLAKKSSSCVERECRTTPLVRGDSAGRHFTLTLASEECSEVPRSTWQGRKTNRFPRQMVECSSNLCTKSVRRSPVLPCRGERAIGFLVKWSDFLSHSNLHQAPFLCCTHAIERVTSKAAGYDCVINASVREGRV